MSIEKLTPGDLNRIGYSIEESFDAGAFGIFLGLGYPPAMYSSQEEITWFAKFATRKNGILAAHLKAYSSLSSCYPFRPGGTPHNIKALKEIFKIVKKSDVSLQISHLIFPTRPTWKTADKIFNIIEKEKRYYADLVIFDYKSINENTNPSGAPRGIKYVFINGKPAYINGKVDKK